MNLDELNAVIKAKEDGQSQSKGLKNGLVNQK